MRRKHPKISEILFAILASPRDAGVGARPPSVGGMQPSVESDRVSIGQVIDSLGDRAFGILLLLLALPNCVPGPPGLSTVTGLPMLLFAAQLLLGARRPWLPDVLRARSFQRTDMLSLVERAAPVLRWVERLSSPRLVILAEWPADRLAGLVLLVLAGILVLPVPLANMLPAAAVALVSLGLLERDGITVLVGYGLAALSLSIAGAVIGTMVAITANLGQRLFG